MSASFEFFDREEDVLITQGCLPHWEQSGKTYFITFRTADSLPEQFERFRRYIADNPRQAGLKDGEYLYYSSG